MPILESKPNSPLALQFPPNSNRSVRVNTGDNWKSIAQSNGIDVWSLIEYNFPVVKDAHNFETKCRQVNWMMRTHIGTTQSDDGKNYRFDSSDQPGQVYLPTSPLPPGSDPMDVKTTTWAIAPIGRPSNTIVEFELVNGKTRLAHRLFIKGVGQSNTSIDSAPRHYYRMRVRSPLSFRDFDQSWASVEPLYPSSHRIKFSLPSETIKFDNNWYHCLWGKDPHNPFEKKPFLFVAIIGRTALKSGDGEPTFPLIWG